MRTAPFRVTTTASGPDGAPEATDRSVVVWGCRPLWRSIDA